MTVMEALETELYAIMRDWTKINTSPVKFFGNENFGSGADLPV